MSHSVHEIPSPSSFLYAFVGPVLYVARSSVRVFSSSFVPLSAQNHRLYPIHFIRMLVWPLISQVSSCILLLSNRDKQPYKYCVSCASMLESSRTKCPYPCVRNGILASSSPFEVGVNHVLATSIKQWVGITVNKTIPGAVCRTHKTRSMSPRGGPQQLTS